MDWTDCDIDSTVLAHVLSLLNQRYDYGLDLYLLSIDEGITGYRDDSLEVSQTNPYPLSAAQFRTSIAGRYSG